TRLRGSRNTHYKLIDSSGGEADFGLFLPRSVVHSRWAHRKFWGVTHPKRWAILGFMCLALVVTGLDSLIVAVTTPSDEEVGLQATGE
ncbi:hypothetical protein, partial [Rothia sp. HMSC036D11]|uniref:hypothetical protein n=1 Tax=Rothia sp. HMSC036D11 TaxID=1739462 RepID=UPI001AEF8059